MRILIVLIAITTMGFFETGIRNSAVEMEPQEVNLMMDQSSGLEVTLLEAMRRGPCSNRGCDASNSQKFCTSYTVFEIGGIAVTRSCKGVCGASEHPDACSSGGGSEPGEV